MFTRRNLLQAGLWGGAYVALPGCSNRELVSIAAGRILEPSPPTTPFIMALPIPPVATTSKKFPSPDPHLLVPGKDTVFYTFVEEERKVRVSPDLNPATFWGYRDINVPNWPFAIGPTVHARLLHEFGHSAQRRATAGVIVRYENQLPSAPRAFGSPFTTVHLHGGHTAAEFDGFPKLLFGPGERFDYAYPMNPPGFRESVLANEDVPSTMWYHDHALGQTSPNVYKGLLGFFLVFDDLDTGSEKTGLRLPSGRFDIPLAVQDKTFAANGDLVFEDVLAGFLGDKFLVNGAIQPYLRVKRRKYRFRVLDGSNARFYRIVLASAGGQTFPMTLIGNEGGLYAAPIRNAPFFDISPAQREEVVIDFAQFPTGTEVFFEQRFEQTNGFAPPTVVARGPQLMKFIVEEAVPDPSQVPDVLRPFAPIPQSVINSITNRPVFNFDTNADRTAFTINGLGADDLLTAIVSPPLNQPVIWRLTTPFIPELPGGGWVHPVHVHESLMRILSINGQPPPLEERDGFARRDTVNVFPGNTVDVFLQFRDFRGQYVFHCHNLDHEDMDMMARFDVV